MWTDIVTITCVVLNIIACIVDLCLYAEVAATCVIFALYRKARRSVQKKFE